MPRHPRQGFTLLATLATILLLTTLVLTLQTRAQSNLRVIARLTADLQHQAVRDSIHDRLRGLVADAMAGASLERRPSLDGTPFAMTEGGRDWVVRVQDVEGLVDLYLGAPEMLALLPIDAAAATSARDAALARQQPGERFPTLAMTLAQFGIDPQAVVGMVTQSSQTGALRIAKMAPALRDRARNIPPGAREGEQVTQVAISIERADTAP